MSGGGCTSIAVFNEGHLVHADVIPMGGQQITEDLSRMFTTPVSAAERIKTLWGAALGDLEASADVIAVPQMGGHYQSPKDLLSAEIEVNNRTLGYLLGVSDVAEEFLEFYFPMGSAGIRPGNT